MLQTWRRTQNLFSDFNTFQFASVMALVVFVLLLVFMVHTEPFHHSNADLPKVFHPVLMRAAARENVMNVFITRDGKIYFGSDQVTSAMLPEKISARLRDLAVERKVYVAADMRARWGAVKPVLEAVRAAGIVRVAFLVDQRRTAPHI